MLADARRAQPVDAERQHLDHGRHRVAADQLGAGLHHLALGSQLAALHPQHRAAVAQPQRPRHVGEARRRDPPDLAGDVGAQRQAAVATPDRRSAAVPAARSPPAGRRAHPHIRSAAAGRGRSRAPRHDRAGRAAARRPPPPAAAGGRADLREAVRRQSASSERQRLDLLHARQRRDLGQHGGRDDVVDRQQQHRLRPAVAAAEVEGADVDARLRPASSRGGR